MALKGGSDKEIRGRSGNTKESLQKEEGGRPDKNKEQLSLYLTLTSNPVTLCSGQLNPPEKS